MMESISPWRAGEIRYIDDEGIVFFTDGNVQLRASLSLEGPDTATPLQSGVSARIQLQKARALTTKAPADEAIRLLNENHPRPFSNERNAIDQWYAEPGSPNHLCLNDAQ